MPNRHMYEAILAGHENFNIYLDGQLKRMRADIDKVHATDWSPPKIEKKPAPESELEPTADMPSE